MKLNYVFLFFTIFYFQTGFTQSNGDLAKAYYLEAEKNYQSSDYYESISNLDKAVEKLSGKSFSKIEYLYVKNYVNRKSFQNAKLHLDKFFKLNTDNNSTMYIEMLDQVIKIDKGIQDEINRKERLRLDEIEKKEKEQKLDKTLTNFEFKTCPECNGNGVDEHNRQRVCSNCFGDKQVLVYTGSDYFSSSEIKSMIDNNRSAIINNIYQKSNNNNGNKNYSNPLFGTWILINPPEICHDKNGNPLYFTFNSDGTGETNSTKWKKFCTDENIITKLYFTYTESTLSWKYDHKNPNTCQLSNSVTWETYIGNYTISKNILSFNDGKGGRYKRKDMNGKKIN